MVNEPVDRTSPSVTEPGDTERTPGDGCGGDGRGVGWVCPGVGDDGEDGCPACPPCPPCPLCPPCAPCCEGVAEGEPDTFLIRPRCCLPPLPPEPGGAGATLCCELADSGACGPPAGPAVAPAAGGGSVWCSASMMRMVPVPSSTAAATAMLAAMVTTCGP